MFIGRQEIFLADEKYYAADTKDTNGRALLCCTTQQGASGIAISEGAGLRIAHCPETCSPPVNLTVIFGISFSTDFDE
jgi:hypothetical protein